MFTEELVRVFKEEGDTQKSDSKNNGRTPKKGARLSQTDHTRAPLLFHYK